jgi:phospholipid/cholesterol/gamma-HCH transport system substrate-binding protein
VEIDRDIQLPADSRAIVTRSLLGEAAIEFIAGTNSNMIEAGGDITGAAAADPLVMVQRLEARTTESLNAFAGTSQEWKRVAENINTLLDTKRGHLDEVVENAADALHEFTIAVKNTNRLIETANKIVGDPKAQQAVKDTLVSLPKLVSTIRTTLEETQQVMDGMNRNLVNLTGVTEPMGKRGTQIVTKLESTLSNVDQLSTELSRFVRTVNQKDGTLQQLVSNPSLYNNLDRSSQSMVILLKHMEPVMKDLREFSDKVARNPELLGLGGAVRPSRGLKDEEILDAKRTNPSKMPNARGKAPQ